MSLTKPLAVTLLVFIVLPATFDVTAVNAERESPNRDNSVPLGNGELRQLVLDDSRGIQGPTMLHLSGNAVHVEILHEVTSEEINGMVRGLGGEVYGEVPGELAEALVPVDRLVELEAGPGVQSIRPPLNVGIPLEIAGSTLDKEQGTLPAMGAITGEEVAKTNASNWHAAGITGQGVKVGIIDGFDSSLWNQAQAAGEVPVPSGTFCRFLGANCSVWDFGAEHGVAVAEIVHEMAPSAQLYVATAATASDLQAAVDYFQSQGIRVISRSQGSEYDGPGDGTGPVDSVVNNAIASGMLWVNAAGNASGGLSPGSYWRGTWNDTNFDGWIEFAPGDPYLGFVCGGIFGVRWSDFDEAPLNRTDYDVYVYDNPGDFFPLSASVDDQTITPPVETSFSCNPGDVDFLSISLFQSGSGTGGDILEFGVNQSSFEYWQNPYGASISASDSANSGSLSVGAIDPPSGSTIGEYSSWGPTNDGRTKPDLSAASCVSSYTYYPYCFSGTSAAAPATAGAAALVRSAGLASSPTSLANFLKNSTVDRGAAGQDNIYGRGELILGTPPAPTPSPTPIGYRQGDANCNGTVESGDVGRLLRIVVGLDVPGGCVTTQDDVDCANGITAVDALAVAIYISGANPLPVSSGCKPIGQF